MPSMFIERGSCHLSISPLRIIFKCFLLIQILVSLLFLLVLQPLQCNGMHWARVKTWNFVKTRACWKYFVHSVVFGWPVNFWRLSKVCTTFSDVKPKSRFTFLCYICVQQGGLMAGRELSDPTRGWVAQRSHYRNWQIKDDLFGPIFATCLGARLTSAGLTRAYFDQGYTAWDLTWRWSGGWTRGGKVL